MNPFLHFCLDRQTCTTAELMKALQEYATFLNIPDPSLEENKPWWENGGVQPVRLPVYVGPPYVYKEISFTEDQLYRCESTGNLWVSGEGVTLDWNQFPADGSCVLEVISLQPFGFWWNRYYITDILPDITEPLRPMPLSLLRYRKINGKLTVTGVRSYCEMLVVAAEYDGMPVDQVLLEQQPETEFLHTLVLEEGIRLVDAPWGLSELTQIRLPSTAALLHPPHDIKQSYWFFGQRDGAVYFQNYYCGTVGKPVSDSLTIRDGTVGVIDEADAELLWHQIHFPDTVAYLGERCFGFTGELPEKISLAYGREALQQAFRDPLPTIGLKKPEIPEKNCWELLKPGPLDESFTGWALYNTGRNNPFVKAVILPGWEPTAPKLCYSSRYGWTAHFWYYSEEKDTAGYYAAIALPSGCPLEIRQLLPSVQLCRTGIWTAEYVPPMYLLARDYLEHCAALIRRGNPDKSSLVSAHNWWKQCCPPEYRPETDELLSDFFMYEQEDIYDP